MRGRSPTSDEICSMATLRASGLSMFEIGSRLGFCYNTVRTCLRSHNTGHAQINRTT